MLPEFSFDSYKNLLVDLLSHFTPKLIKEFTGKENKTLFIRHDIDFFVGGWEKIPVIENQLGIKTTYYFLLDDYNLITNKNYKYIKKYILENGHDVGLHIDFSKIIDTNYVEKSIKILETFLDIQIKTITIHRPNKNKETDILNRYINPFSSLFLNNVEYISESARGWRNLNILNYKRYNNLILATHPENWLNCNILDRLEYFYSVMVPNRIFYHGDVHQWKSQWFYNLSNHIGGKLYDELQNDVKERAK